ncbi:U-box domain-containing protein 39-like [Oryza brachyantha]|uniref:U-box domain-containing protein 39-like n=1 Tax=Oryza brachyantha TaxID=4533 RepID=UPI001AD980F0|nr:U-box domain-containing protein 39-like [Oryza brachyantha]
MAGATPPEFVCPISGELMGDPVIVPTGETFERGCVEACIALGFTPAALSACMDLAASPPPVLIPNANLKRAISSYCDRAGLPHPFAVAPEEARSIVRRLMAAQEPAPATRVDGGRFESSPSSSREFSPLGLTQEEVVLVRLLDDEPSRQEGALEALKQTLRGGENGQRRALCTPRLLDGLRRLMGSVHEGVRVSAAACVVNLSLEPANRVQLVRAELVPVLVKLLVAASPELRDHAAGAIHSLSIEERNRIPMGVLGAVPPLLQLLASAADGDRARRDAGMALYYLSLDEMNRARLAKSVGTVPILVNAAGEAALRRPALMVIANLAGCGEGREALIGGGAVAAVAGLMRRAAVAPGSTEEEYCLSALHGMSRGNVRFGGLARAAGADEVLRRVAEGTGGGVRRDVAWRTLRAVGGNAGAGAAGAGGQYGSGEDAASPWLDDVSVMSEAMAMPQFPRRLVEQAHGAPPRSNTTALDSLRQPPVG